MARGSGNPTSNSRFKVWDLAGDLYSHTDLAENWDTLDQILGRPINNADWPPMGQRGIGKGLYLYIKLLEAERAPIGATVWWWRPDATVPMPAGHELMDGRIIAAANHHFPGVAADIRLPNALNAFPIGADPSKPMSTRGDTTNSPSGAPGVTTHNGAVNVGGGGSNSHTHTHTVPTHSHAIGFHSHTVDGHTHNFDHRHNITSRDGTPAITGTAAPGTIAYQLKGSALDFIFEIYPPGGPLPPGTGVRVLGYGHRHHGGGVGDSQFLAGTPVQSSNLSASRLDTGAAAPGTSIAGGGATGDVGETAVSSKELDNRPNHIGLIPLMKVRYATSL